jgi:DNA-binding PadR family transcriptional regulator
METEKRSLRPPVARLSRRQRRILTLLAAGGEMAGLELVAASPALGRGTVYVALRRLADKGLVESRPVNGFAGELPRRLFHATRPATAALEAVAVDPRRPRPAAMREAAAC